MRTQFVTEEVFDTITSIVNKTYKVMPRGRMFDDRELHKIVDQTDDLCGLTVQEIGLLLCDYNFYFEYKDRKIQTDLLPNKYYVAVIHDENFTISIPDF